MSVSRLSCGLGQVGRPPHMVGDVTKERERGRVDLRKLARRELVGRLDQRHDGPPDLAHPPLELVDLPGVIRTLGCEHPRFQLVDLRLKLSTMSEYVSTTASAIA